MATATRKHLIAILASVVCLVAVCQSELISGASSDVSPSETERYQSRQRRDGDRPYINSQADRIEFLQAHNKFRNDFTSNETPQPEAANMPRMYWSALLEASITDMTSQCRFDHFQTALVKQPYFINMTSAYGEWIGQNIYQGPKPNAGMINAFSGETKDYTYQKGRNGDCTPKKPCGHFTQVVWEGTILVGCGSAKCNGHWVGGCNYLPGGNYRGAQPYQDGPSCSLCSSNKFGFTECEGRLCVPKDRCSPVKECAVVDKENCLCSEESYKKIVVDLLKGDAISIRSTFAIVIPMTLLVVSVLNA